MSQLQPHKADLARDGNEEVTAAPSCQLNMRRPIDSTEVRQTLALIAKGDAHMDQDDEGASGIAMPATASASLTGPASPEGEGRGDTTCLALPIRDQPEMQHGYLQEAIQHFVELCCKDQVAGMLMRLKYIDTQLQHTPLRVSLVLRKAPTDTKAKRYMCWQQWIANWRLQAN